jgi:copper chaperone
MTTTIQIENLKCGGCAVNVETSEVNVSHGDNVIDLIKEKLSKLGYPESGDKNTVLHKAKSFVSCAVGRLDKE